MRDDLEKSLLSLHNLLVEKSKKVKNIKDLALRLISELLSNNTDSSDETILTIGDLMDRTNLVDFEISSSLSEISKILGCGTPEIYSKLRNISDDICKEITRLHDRINNDIHETVKIYDRILPTMEDEKNKTEKNIGELHILHKLKKVISDNPGRI